MCTSTFPLPKYTGKTQSLARGLNRGPDGNTNTPHSLAKIQWETSTVFIDRNEAAAPDSWETFLSPGMYTLWKVKRTGRGFPEVSSPQLPIHFWAVQDALRSGWDHYGRSHQLPQRAGSSLHDLWEHNYRKESALESCVFNTRDFGPKTVMCS